MTSSTSLSTFLPLPIPPPQTPRSNSLSAFPLRLPSPRLRSRPSASITAAITPAAPPSLPFRVGHGFDLHRLEPGLPLIVGGVDIPHDRGCEAHSDGDVLLHCVVDAVLGALGLPDIGQLFPDSDPRWQGADSSVFVREAKHGFKAINLPRFLQILNIILSLESLSLKTPDNMELWLVKLMHEAGYEVGNIDATLILQKPKLSPHKDAIRTNLCKLLGADPSVVNIKAKTHEKVDSLGENRSIAAHTVVLLMRK